MWERHHVTVAQADEALSDADAVWLDPDPKSRSGRSIRVIGHCASRDQILTVMVLRGESVSRRLWGLTGWPSNSTDRRTYRERTSP